MQMYQQFLNMPRQKREMDYRVMNNTWKEIFFVAIPILIIGVLIINQLIKIKYGI